MATKKPKTNRFLTASEMGVTPESEERMCEADAQAAEKQSKKSGRGGARPGAGRPKGSLDKGNALIREMIAQALDEVGGVEYLATTARTHQAAFLALIGKVMPIQVEGGGGGPLQHSLKVTFE